MQKRIEEIIQTLNLVPHPEGGYFAETYRSSGEINEDSLSPAYIGKRNYSTSIYFLLTSDTFSSFHRIKQDEIWHFYEGSPIHLHTITETGLHADFKIGLDFTKGHNPQLVVPGGYWFGAHLMEEDSYALVGCTVSPGFDFSDFELGERSGLIEEFPEHHEIITKLTRPVK